MIDEKLIEVATQTLLESIESSAYLFADMDPVYEINFSTDEWLCWQLEYHGHCDGRCLLYAPIALGKKATANMLGVDPEDIQEEAITDAMGEILNIFTGLFLTSYYGEEPIFDLSIPTPISFDPPSLEDPHVIPASMENVPIIVEVHSCLK